MTDIASMILDAQRAGFRVTEEEGFYWLTVPARPRHPEAILGAWDTSERAWRAAALVNRQINGGPLDD